MSVVVCGLLCLLMIFSILTNRDLLSPGKFYLVSFVLFYAGALSSPDDYELWLLILLVLLVGVATVCLEAGARPMPSVHRVPGRRRNAPRERSVTFWIWLASLPAIAAQIYMIRFFNGIEGYINMIGNRVIELRGLGWAKTLIATIVVLNLIYFALGLTRSRSRFWWMAWGAHLLVAMIMGALSGSRGSILTIFAAQVFVYHYLRRPVKISFALPAGALLVASAMVIGVVRQSIKVDAGDVSTGIESTDQVLQLAIFNYGVQPLHLLLSADQLRLANGSTLLSVITNVVPRNWWPEKPDTGGVFFTKQYAGNAWDGASNLTPTYLGEGVINFGWTGGLTFFVVTDLLLMYLVVVHYKRVLREVRGPPDARAALDVVVYIVVMWAAVGLMVGEVSNTVQDLVLTQVLPALTLKFVLAANGRKRPMLQVDSP